ncbi:MAG: diaminopimelate decarboxylase [Bacteroidales bacterium]|nr:diaminopimelate decarboxylase [Bacteroidales bacterium]MDD3432157.1 diaminopimelate decarboxylase [Bacteroidales bacterium]MDD4431125.1 diaminopimelate decarboxylase [Bacteroidales bacterium]
MDLKGSFPINSFKTLQTPFYYYDLEILRSSLDLLRKEADRNRIEVHYAVKANANPRILAAIQAYGFGADCVSGGEMQAALQAGFPSSRVVFAGVGKADWEIDLGLKADIFCFNVESAAELEVIDQRAAGMGKKARVALRINPNVQADTHHYITTGLSENKFGIPLQCLDEVLDLCMSLDHLELIGLHFHIGSQITEMDNFAGLCARVNEIQNHLDQRQLSVQHINLGGGLGIDYHHPDKVPVPDFSTYMHTIRKMLVMRPGQSLHIEPGRSVVAQCGSLISKVLYIKKGLQKEFVVLDAGMTELIRPALYQAYHKIENISSEEPEQKYDVVGPICESSDTFGKQVVLNKTRRGDLVAIRSTGAYAEIMASNYNLRPKAPARFSDDLLN